MSRGSDRYAVNVSMFLYPYLLSELILCDDVCKSTFCRGIQSRKLVGLEQATAPRSPVAWESSFLNRNLVLLEGRYSWAVCLESR
jgi:hypothetical protein